MTAKYPSLYLSLPSFAIILLILNVPQQVLNVSSEVLCEVQFPLYETYWHSEWLKDHRNSILMIEFGYCHLSCQLQNGRVCLFFLSLTCFVMLSTIMATISSSSPDASAVWLDFQHLESKTETVSIIHIPCLQYSIIVLDNRLRRLVLTLSRLIK